MRSSAPVCCNRSRLASGRYRRHLYPDTLDLHDLGVLVIQQIINCLDDFIRQGLDLF